MTQAEKTRMTATSTAEKIAVNLTATFAAAGNLVIRFDDVLQTTTEIENKFIIICMYVHMNNGLLMFFVYGGDFTENLFCEYCQWKYG